MKNPSISDFVRIAFDEYNNAGTIEGEKVYANCLTQPFWKNLNTITLNDVNQDVIPFLNKWRCRLSAKCAEDLFKELQRTESRISSYRGMRIYDQSLLNQTSLDVFLNTIEEIARPICDIRVGKRTVGLTATSKILHMCIPEFFVMTDEKIRWNYGCEGNGTGYANFILRMNLFAKYLVAQNIQGSVPSKYSSKKIILAKILDQYNYSKYTLGIK